MGLSSYIKAVYVKETTQAAIYSESEIKEIMKAYPDMSTSIKMYTVPGLKKTISYSSSGAYNTGNCFVPQGICVAGQYLLISAYDGNEALNSVIYVIRSSDCKYLTTIITSGKEHVGGIAYDTVNKYIWIAWGYNVIGFPYTDLQQMIAMCSSDNMITGFLFSGFPKKYSVRTRASYCTYYDGLLWVGLYNDKGVGDIFAYKVNLSSSALSTQYVIEAPQYSQGMDFYKSGTDVYLAISTSHGRSASKVRIYKTGYSSPISESGQNYKRILKNTAVSILEFPPMLEEITRNGSLVYVVFESASEKYIGNILYAGVKRVDKILRYNAGDFFLK